MLRGLSQVPKVFVKKITIENVNATNPEGNKGNFVNFYTDNVAGGHTQSKKIKLTFDINLKLQYPADLWRSSAPNSLKYRQFEEKTLKFLNNGLFLKGVSFSKKDKFQKFIATSSKQFFTLGKEQLEISIPYINDLKKYTYYYDNIPYVTIPVKAIKLQNYGETEQNGLQFLAYAFALCTNNNSFNNKPTVVPNTVASEIIFNQGKIVNKTGMFVIGDTYTLKGKKHNLSDSNDFSKLVKAIYGDTGDMWFGPIHMSNVGTTKNIRYRAMAGISHSLNAPHPFLNYIIMPNKKIIDARGISEIENIFSHDTNLYSNFLATSSEIKYTTQKKKNTIDELIQDKAIVSEALYSVRNTQHESEDGQQSPKQKTNIHVLFAIDKMRLLKETTTLPGLLDKLSDKVPGISSQMAAAINIFHFEIIRIDKKTGISKSLLVCDNDLLFPTGKFKNYQLRNKTRVAKFANKQGIDIYEFTDGEIEANKLDNKEYTYKINLKFKDPITSYLLKSLETTKKIIQDLDELLTKSEMKIYDKSRKKVVNVYDSNQRCFNPQFVSEAINAAKSTALASLPLTFDITSDGIPSSIDKAFPVLYDSTAINLSILLSCLNGFNDLEPKKNYRSINTSGMFESVNSYIRNSLVLATSSPMRIQKVRSFMALIESKLVQATRLFSTIKITKKEGGYTDKDYQKSTNIKNASTHISEYSYTFGNSIDISKTKNRFNWIVKPNNVNVDGSAGLKTISVQDYQSLVTINRDSYPRKDTLLSDDGRTQAKNNLFSYSYLPLMGASIELFNNDLELDRGFNVTYFQTIRKKLYDKITNKGESILAPELLSFFGIRFVDDKKTSYIVDAMTKKEKDIVSPLNDNFGQSYNLANTSITKKGITLNTAYGSVEDENYKWQGTTLDRYPISLAYSIINLINADKTRDINSLRDTVATQTDASILDNAGIYKDNSMPFEVNLFSSNDVVQSVEPSIINKDWLNLIFDSNGNINYENYEQYILFLGLFGNVQYLSNFGQGSLSPDVAGLLTPTSHNNRNMIKSMIWRPLSEEVLSRLSAPQHILCKVELFENPLLDTNIVNLFKQYYNYNQYFWLTPTSGGALFRRSRNNSTSGDIGSGERQRLAINTLETKNMRSIAMEREKPLTRSEKNVIRDISNKVESGTDVSVDGSHSHTDIPAINVSLTDKVKLAMAIKKTIANKRNTKRR